MTRNGLTIMKKTWILITDAERARCFERDTSDHSLKELTDFIHPRVSLQGKAGGGDMTGEAGKGHGRTGHAGTQFEPHTEALAKERANFARDLANYLNTGVAERSCHALVLVATSPMLGEIKSQLNSASDKVLVRCIASDLTRYTGRDLEKRVEIALRLPE
jgi:protein required for attachment to host cells